MSRAGFMRLSPRGLVILVLAVAVVIVAGALAIARLSSSGRGAAVEGRAGPTKGAGLSQGMPRPSRAEARTTMSHLQGAGRPLETFRTAAKSASEHTPSQATCRSTAADLNRSASSDTVLAQAGQVSDEPYRALLLAIRTTLGVYLTSCSQGDMARAMAEHARLVELTSALEIRHSLLEETAR